MKTGSGNRSDNKRNSGKETAHSNVQNTAKKTARPSTQNAAKKTSRPSTQNTAGKKTTRARSQESTVNPSRVVYNDYYDFPRKKKDSGSTVSIVIAACVILAVLALVVAGLALLKPEQRVTGDLVTAAPLGKEEREVKTGNSGSQAPVIYGINPIVVYAGSPVAYKAGVYVEDDTDSNPTLEIDNEEVDLTKPGTYVVTYIATDKDHNETREPNTVTVMPGTNLVSEDKINELADQVLETIIPDDTISDEMKCLKIYEYLHAIGYVDEVHSEDWMQNAYWMLSKREGDCFCYYSAARLLLTRLGYEVMEVRNNNNYVHYWCLVSIDGGNTWWHFDPCCWSWGEDGIICLVSDHYLQEFTRRHYTSDGRLIHAWDMTKYPATPEEDFWTDEDRSVIYESGLIDVDAQYDASLWDNEGWDNYQIPYAYEIPEEYYYSEDTYVPESEEPVWEDTAEYPEPDLPPEEAGYYEEPAPVEEGNGGYEEPSDYTGGEGEV